jgi:hypothetical protein
MGRLTNAVGAVKAIARKPGVQALGYSIAGGIAANAIGGQYPTKLKKKIVRKPRRRLNAKPSVKTGR